MKYWYLEKYRGLKITELESLKEDLKFFNNHIKYTKKEAEELLTNNISDKKEEELLILLHYILYYKKSALNKIVSIIDKLLLIPDTSMPITDYSLKEMLNEIKNLRAKANRPTKDKLEYNNIASCYNCLNVFYVDKIKYTNKKNICLCPFCKSTNIYFDNDYIPMDFFFLKLSRLYYKETPLGCNFKNIQKLLKKSINYIKNKESIILKSSILTKSKILSKDKKITSKEEVKLLFIYYQKLKEYDLTYNFNLTIEVPVLSPRNKTVFSLFLLIFITSILGENPYLKKVFLTFKQEEDKTYYKKLFQTLITFS